MHKFLNLIYSTLPFLIIGACSVSPSQKDPEALSPKEKRYEQKLLEWMDAVNWSSVDSLRKDEDVSVYEDEIPNGFSIYDKEWTKLDFNQDGMEDLAMIVENEDAEPPLSILVLEGTKDSYQLKTQSGDLFYENVRITTIKGNILLVEHQSMRHDFQLRFQYDKTHDDFMLIGSMLNYYGGGSSAPNKYLNDFLEKSVLYFTSEITPEEYIPLPPKKLPLTINSTTIQAINDANIDGYLDTVK